MTDSIASLNSEGLWEDDPGAISTISRRKVNPLTTSVANIDINDIAHALSRQCRYNGHTTGHLSVARHSIWVADRVREVLYRNPRPLPLDQRLQLILTALLHDAAEAYLGDLVKPLKHSEFGAAYLEAERDLEAKIARRFGLAREGDEWPELVMEADRYVSIEREMHDLRWTWDSNADSDKTHFLFWFTTHGGGQ